MARITISYRRDDSGVITGRIFDRLVGHFGRDAIFRDIDNIPIGVDFRKHIEHVFDSTDIVLAIVGPHWVGPSETQNRLSNEADPVRVEIEGAIRKGARLIPILVLGATMPTAGELPEGLKDFAYLNAVQLDAGQDFDFHMARLIRAIDGILGLTSELAPTPGLEPIRPPKPADPGKRRSITVAAGVACLVLGAGVAIGWYAGFGRENSTAAREDGPRTPPQTGQLQSAAPAPPPAAGSVGAAPGKSETAASAAAAPPIPALPGDAELLFWQSAASSGTAADYKAYLHQFPQGRFVDLANNRLAALQPTPESMPPKPAPPTQVAINRPSRPVGPREQCAAPEGLAGIRQYCASSVLPAQIGDRTGRSNYGVANLFDSDPATAWVKARAQPGNGWILVDLDGERQVTAIAVSNGYQKSATSFRTNFRVHRLRLLSSSGETASVLLADTGGNQRITLDHPMRAEWVQIFVDELFPGVPEADVALSELRVISEKAP
jgi:hypothetical protein